MCIHAEIEFQLAANDETNTNTIAFILNYYARIIQFLC